MTAQTTENIAPPARRRGAGRVRNQIQAVSEPPKQEPKQTPAQKAAATRAAKALEVKKQSEALAKELENKPVPAKPKTKAAKEPRVTGHRQWAAKPITPAMLKFSTWIEREFPELGKTTSPRDQRLIMIASKAYTAFQGSDLNDD